MADKSNITFDDAVKICSQIREQRKSKWYNLSLLQCWGCWKFSGGDYDKMCMKSASGYDGCNLINKRYGRKDYKKNNK